MFLPTQYKLKPPPSVRLVTGHPLADQLAGCWLLNERGGLKAFDKGSARIDLAFGNSPTWSAGKYGRAVLFVRASSQYLQADSSPVTGSADTFTLLVWFNTDNVEPAQVAVFAGDKDAADQYSYLSLAGMGGGQLLWAYTVGGAASGLAASSKIYTAGKWHQGVGVFKGTSYRAAYLDGSNKGTNAAAVTATGFDRTAIGAARDSTPGSYFSGKIAVVMIWARALSDSEIAYLYRRPFCMFERKGRW